MGRTLDIRIEVPDDANEETLHLAERTGKEAAVLFLQQKGELSIREAAMELSLTYEGYLDLLADRGLPATADCTDPAVLEAFQQRIRARGKLPA